MKSHRLEENISRTDNYLIKDLSQSIKKKKTPQNSIARKQTTQLKTCQEFEQTLHQRRHVGGK